jgi:predicted nuclease of restriction endonuclease-like (RecB) superfamily
MRVVDPAARRFYETEAVQANWSRRDLERQIGSAQLFAAKYQLTLPSEEDLQREILRERALIENQLEST